MKSQATADLLLSSSRESPLIAQLFGSEPARMAEAAGLLRMAGWLYFDCNMGCPAKKVIRQGAGSALLANPEKALAVARALLQTVKNPADSWANSGKSALVGFKIRSGFEKGDNIALDLALRLEDAGADWIACHPRYGKEAFTGKADWDLLEILAKRLGIPLLASGDLFTEEDGVQCMAQTGARGVMYARGALRNPAIFSRHKLALQGKRPQAATVDTLTEIVKRHIEAGRRHYNSSHGFNKLRSILPRYVKHLPGVGDFRQRLSRCADWDCLIFEVESFISKKQEMGEA